MTNRSESQLEKFIADFVWDKASEKIRLHLADDITIRPSQLRRRTGSYLLAIFWSNILQHELNFPPSKFTYNRRQPSDDKGGKRDLLELQLTDETIQISVDMSSGVLTVSGQFVYEWFTTKFRQLLENVDELYAADWKFVPTPSSELPMTDDDRWRPYDDDKTETEAYLLFEGRGTQRLESRLQQRLADKQDVVLDTKHNLHTMWSSDEVDRQLEQLQDTGGGMFDGALYVYPLWLSVLHQWFSRSDGAKVYIATPCIDSDRLEDITDICLHHTGVQLAALYTNYNDCDPNSSSEQTSNAAAVQQLVLDKYDSSQRAVVEYQVLRRISYPQNQRLAGSASFIARVPCGTRGRMIDILLLGSSLRSTDFSTGKLSHVALVRTTLNAFHNSYLQRLETGTVTSTELY